MATLRNERILRAIPVLIAVCLFCFPVYAQYGGGTGGPSDPYLIYTAEQMNAIGADANDWDKHFKLMVDIDLSGYTGRDFNIIGTDRDNPFTGVFDGSGKKISNFSYTSTDANDIGLFGIVHGRIKDLGLIDPNIDAGTGRFVASLVGLLSDATITGCYVEAGSVSGGDEVGGLVGSNWESTITNCYATGSVSGAGWGVGGLVGWNLDGTITNCYSAGSVSGDWRVGGLVGWNLGDFRRVTISNCYSAGSVSGDWRVGGLVGSNANFGTITDCYAVGRVIGTTDVGGLVGKNLIGTVTYSFWDIQTSGQPNSDGGTGKTTAEMQTATTFLDAGWDFVDETANGTEDIWWILEGQDYPRLWWELIP